MPHTDPDATIPLHEEQLEITKQDVVADRVRVRTDVVSHPVEIADDLRRGVLRVERVAVDRPVEVAPEPRQDGDTMIVSLVEERLVVEKRLFVIEEVRVTRSDTTDHVVISETVRRMRATIEQTGGSSSKGREIDG